MLTIPGSLENIHNTVSGYVSRHPEKIRFSRDLRCHRDAEVDPDFCDIKTDLKAEGCGTCAGFVLLRYGATGGLL
jgi:hypothetical protein